jgi:hypothetical protein
MCKKSQAAMEFLMTYGWALLIILLVIAALAYFGMLNPERFLPDKVTVSDNRIQIIPTQSNGIIIKNVGADTLYNVQINMTNHNCRISPTNTLAPGEIIRQTILCDDTPSANGRLKGDIKINYSTISYGEIMSKNIYANYAVRGNYFSSNGLVGYWPLDTDTNDYSGNSNHGTIVGTGVTKTSAGKSNGAYSFNGVLNNYINIPNSASLQQPNEVTVTAWIKTTISATYLTILSKDNENFGGGGRSYLIEMLNGANAEFVTWRIGETSQWGKSSLSTLTLNDGKWHHIAATSSPNIDKLYIDGKLDQTTTPTFSASLYTNTVDLIIGQKGGGSLFTFNGQIDEVMVFNRALSADEIKALYAAAR